MFRRGHAVVPAGLPASCAIIPRSGRNRERVGVFALLGFPLDPVEVRSLEVRVFVDTFEPVIWTWFVSNLRQEGSKILKQKLDAASPIIFEGPGIGVATQALLALVGGINGAARSYPGVAMLDG